MNISVEQVLESRLGTELTEQEAAILAELMELREIGSGEYLITEGMSDDSLHVLVEGTLEVVKRTAGDTTASIAIIREGHLAGELSFIDGNVHTVGLRALSDCKIISLARDDFETIVDEKPQLIYKVLRAVARSAHRIVHQMNHEFIELNNYIFKQHGRY